MSTLRQRTTVRSPISGSRAQGGSAGSHPSSRGRVEELDSDDPGSYVEGEDGSDYDDDDEDEEEEKASDADTLLAEEDSARIGILDIFRVIFLFLIISSALSYYVTSNSIIWGLKRPWFTKWPVLDRYLVRICHTITAPSTQVSRPRRDANLRNQLFQRGPLLLTPSELALYNGTSPTLPLYISINHTIYDVSANSGMYGPGASYNVFAGRDATRAFITGCFAQDLTDDLRGVEEMFLPLDYDDESSLPSSEYEREYTLKMEMKEAKRMVKAHVKGWQDFYAKSDRYFEVGRLVDSGEGGDGKWEKRELCESAQKGRGKRNEMKQGGTGVYGPMAERIKQKKGKSGKR